MLLACTEDKQSTWRLGQGQIPVLFYVDSRVHTASNKHTGAATA